MIQVSLLLTALKELDTGKTRNVVIKFCTNQNRNKIKPLLKELTLPQLCAETVLFRLEIDVDNVFLFIIIIKIDIN